MSLARGAGVCSSESWVATTGAEVLAGRDSLNDPLRTGGGLDVDFPSLTKAGNWGGSVGLQSAGFLGASVGFALAVGGDATALTCGSVGTFVNETVDSTDFAAVGTGFGASGFSVGEPGASSVTLVGGDFTPPSVPTGSTRPPGFCSVSFCSFGGHPFLADSSSRSVC